MCPVSLLVWGSLRLAPTISCGQLLPYSNVGKSVIVFITYIFYIQIYIENVPSFTASVGLAQACPNNQLWSTPSLQYCREVSDCIHHIHL